MTYDELCKYIEKLTRDAEAYTAQQAKEEEDRRGAALMRACDANDAQLTELRFGTPQLPWTD